MQNYHVFTDTISFLQIQSFQIPNHRLYAPTTKANISVTKIQSTSEIFNFARVSNRSVKWFCSKSLHFDIFVILNSDCDSEHDETSS